MDLKLILGTMVTLFLAELGDKTMLAVISGSSKTQKPIEIFIGAVLGLAIVTALGAFFGNYITNLIPKEYIEKGASLLFVGIGVLMFFGKI
ncbi:TMEM165/GDT1 family protein [bacterium]|nr:TMEM165/GDT1 family protein [bacterium]